MTTGSIPVTVAVSAERGPVYAVYFPENANDQGRARSLAIELQQKYAAVLAARRLSYRGVRIRDDVYNFRVRLAGLTHDEATRICEEIRQRSGTCEIGAN